MELILFSYRIKGIKEMPKIKFPPHENILISCLITWLNNYILCLPVLTPVNMLS